MTAHDKFEHWYPDFINKLSSQIKEEEAAKTLIQTKEVFSWLLTLKL